MNYIKSLNGQTITEDEFDEIVLSQVVVSYVELGHDDKYSLELIDGSSVEVKVLFDRW